MSKAYYYFGKTENLKTFYLFTWSLRGEIEIPENGFKSVGSPGNNYSLSLGSKISNKLKIVPKKPHPPSPGFLVTLESELIPRSI